MFNYAVMVRSAFATVLVGLVYQDTSSVALTVLLGLFFLYTELSAYIDKTIFSRLPSEQDMNDIRKATEDMNELKKHMNWD